MRKPSPAMIVALLSLFVALGGVGVAATGDTFILGQSNTATTNTALSAPVAGGTALRVTNNDTSSAASTALSLMVASGHAPFTVNTGIKVAGLNSDKLDGFDSTYFLPKTGKAANSDKLDGIDSTAFLPTSVVRPVGPVYTTPSQPQLLLASLGQFSFYGRCTSDQLVQLIVKSSADHATLASFGPSFRAEAPDVVHGVSYTLANVVGSPSAPKIVPTTGQVVSADGHFVTFNLYMAQNARGTTGGSCDFGGLFIVNSNGPVD